MPDTKIAFIDPAAALAALTPTVVEADVLEDLGPSAPHDEEPVEVELSLGRALDPGDPPMLGEVHYTQVLDQIWPEFDDPEERTAARLDSLLDEVTEEATRVGLLGQRVWAKLPWYKVDDAERERWDREFLAYLRRLSGYRTTLMGLEPSSTDTDAVYVGLVKRAQGAGPVPDCIMHLYFAKQLGILEDHGQEMSAGFVGRFMDGLARVDAGIDQTIDDAGEGVDQAQKAVEQLFSDIGAGLKRGLWIVGGMIVGTIVLIGGTVVVVRSTRPERSG